MSNSWLAYNVSSLFGKLLGHRNSYWHSRSDMVYHLKYLDFHTSRSLSSYGSD